METMKEILVVYGRIITILPLLLIVTLFMGKRSIGEMPVFDFLINESDIRWIIFCKCFEKKMFSMSAM